MSKEIQGLTYMYEAHKGPRTLLLLHGTGGNERDMLSLGEELDPDAHLLSVRGAVTENGMNRFFKRHTEGVLDRTDLLKRSEQLRDFIIATKKQHDITQFVGVGFSNGANILLHCMCMHPEEFSAAILLRPISAALPAATSSLNELPVFIGSGLHDTLVPAGDSARLDSVLRAAGAVTILSHTNQAHRLGADDMQAARTWLDKLPTATVN